MELHTKNCHKWIDVDFRKNQIQISLNLYYGWLRKTWYKIWLWIKRGKSNCSSFKQTWPRRFIGHQWLLINVSFAHMNFLINTPPCLSPFIPFSGFHLPRLRHSLASVAGMAHNSRGGCLQGGGPATTSLSVFLGVVRRPCQESEVPRWRWGAVLGHCPRASSSALHGRGQFFVGPGEEPVHVRKGQVGGLQQRPPWRGSLFSSTRRKKRSMRIEVTTLAITPATILKTMRQVMKPWRTRFVLVPSHFTNQLF
jgi:hypothetical protein